MSQSRHNATPPGPLPDAAGVCAPGWITDALIADTIQTWQPYYDEPLTEQDAIEMLVNVGRLLDLLEADHAREKAQARKST
ncbi:MAG: hypothetical protein ACPGYV_10320 [Phycisphaeraceae bacterium]